MYVIYPADEVVYLSYGRVIVIPRVNTQGREAADCSSASPKTPQVANDLSVPSTSTSSTRSYHSVVSGPSLSNLSEEQEEDENEEENFESNQSLEKNKSSYVKNSPKSFRERVSSLSKFIKEKRHSADNSKSSSSSGTLFSEKPPPSPRSAKLNFLNINLHHRSRSVSPSEPIKRRLSYTDYLSANRSNSPINTKIVSDSHLAVPKRERSPRGVEGPFLRVPQFTGKSSKSAENLPQTSSASAPCSSNDIVFEFNNRQNSKFLTLPRTRTQSLSAEKSNPPSPRRKFFGSFRSNKRATTESHSRMADSALKDLAHPFYNDTLKGHNSVTFKLVRTVSDFTQQLGQIYEHQAEELQLLVSNFRKRNGELRKERPACPSSLFHVWETLLQEVEIDSQGLSDIASILGRQVSRSLLEKSFFRKIQSRKVFTHRDSYEAIINKTEEKLSKCRQDYKNAYLAYLTNPTTDSLSSYFNTHNAYVQQLHATNGMLDEYTKETLPQLLKELEEIYCDLCSTISDAIVQEAEVVSVKAMEQHKRYESLASQCRNISGVSDLSHLARSLPPAQGRGLIAKRIFVPPQPPQELIEGAEGQEMQNDNTPPPLKNSLVIDRLSAVQVLPAHEALSKEAADLESQIRQVQDSLDTLQRIQVRSLEAALYNKANELQEDISMKRFDLRVAQMHLSAINSQKELFSHKLEASDTCRERKMSSSSTGSMKTKWLKAFKSLKTPPPVKDAEKKNGTNAGREMPRTEPDVHSFQEYTYKKITPCDVCSQILRGHTKQGLKCRSCKMNVHLDCQEKAPKCQPKSRLLRRQKSTSEIESRVPEPTLEEENLRESDRYPSMTTFNRQLSFRNSHTPTNSPDSTSLDSTEVDRIYQVLKQATEISNNKPRFNLEPPYAERTAVSASVSSGSSGQSINRRSGLPATQGSSNASTLTVNNPVPSTTSSERKHASSSATSTTTSSPMDSISMRRRLFAGMKSLTGFGSRYRRSSPGHRSISLPETPHSPRRQKLNIRMKSLSLDSPESTEYVQKRKHHGAATSEPHSKDSSSSRIDSPSSPVHNRRLLSAKNMRMSSVELPDDNEKSHSSASASPCPSPVGGKKSHRLLPTNLYVILYNFKARHQDELDLKAGDKVTVIDFSDPDWWKGKCLGRIGYFPSKYCSKLSAGEKALQVTHNLQLSDGDNGLMLLRDQIVIQIGEEVDGVVMIRSGDNRQGVCPIKFLQEV